MKVVETEDLCDRKVMLLPIEVFTTVLSRVPSVRTSYPELPKLVLESIILKFMIVSEDHEISESWKA